MKREWPIQEHLDWPFLFCGERTPESGEFFETNGFRARLGWDICGLKGGGDVD